MRPYVCVAKECGWWTVDRTLNHGGWDENLPLVYFRSWERALRFAVAWADRMVGA